MEIQSSKYDFQTVIAKAVKNTGCPILNGPKVQNRQNSSRGSKFSPCIFLFLPCFRNNRKKPSILDNLCLLITLRPINIFL